MRTLFLEGSEGIVGFLLAPEDDRNGLLTALPAYDAGSASHTYGTRL